MSREDVTDVAIASWEKRNQAESSLPKRQPHRSTRSVEIDSAPNSPLVSRPTRRRRGVVDSSSSPAPTVPQSDDVVGAQPEPEISDSLIDSPLLRVQISQHSSFPRDQYTRYNPTQSTKDTSSSQPELIQSILFEEPATIASSSPVKVEQNGTIPDSQASANSIIDEELTSTTATDSTQLQLSTPEVQEVHSIREISSAVPQTSSPIRDIEFVEDSTISDKPLKARENTNGHPLTTPSNPQANSPKVATTRKKGSQKSPGRSSSYPSVLRGGSNRKILPAPPPTESQSSPLPRRLEPKQQQASIVSFFQKKASTTDSITRQTRSRSGSIQKPNNSAEASPAFQTQAPLITDSPVPDTSIGTTSSTG